MQRRMAVVRTPRRRAGDAVVETGELLPDGERHQVLILHRGHGPCRPIRLPAASSPCRSWAARRGGFERCEGGPAEEEERRGGSFVVKRWGGRNEARLPLCSSSVALPRGVGARVRFMSLQHQFILHQVLVQVYVASLSVDEPAVFYFLKKIS